MRRDALTGSWWGVALAFVSLAAFADQTVKLVDPQAVPLVTWGWVLGLAVGGWFASSAPNLASWSDGEGIELLKKRLEVMRGFAVSMIAGFVAYLLALYSGAPNLLGFIGVLCAAYGGDKYLAPIAERFRSDAKQ